MLMIYYVKTLIWGIYVVKTWRYPVTRGLKRKKNFWKPFQKQQYKSVIGLDHMMSVFYQRGKLSPVDRPNLID